MEQALALAISDLHLETELMAGEFIDAVGSFVASHPVKWLFLAGDIVDDDTLLESILTKICSLPLDAVFFVPGNHEIMIKGDIEASEMPEPFSCVGLENVDSHVKYMKLRQNLKVFEPRLHFMHDRPEIIKYGSHRVAVVGNMGWPSYEIPGTRYGHNFQDAEVAVGVLSLLSNKERQGHFSEKVHGKRVHVNVDMIFHEYMLDMLGYQLREVQQKQIKHVIILTHFIPLPEHVIVSLEKKPGPKEHRHPESQVPATEIDSVEMKNEYASNFYGRIKEMVEACGFTSARYIFGHSHIPVVRDNALCNPNRRNVIPYREQFKRGLFTISNRDAQRVKKKDR